MTHSSASCERYNVRSACKNNNERTKLIKSWFAFCHHQELAILNNVSDEILLPPGTIQGVIVATAASLWLPHTLHVNSTPELHRVCILVSFLLYFF